MLLDEIRACTLHGHQKVKCLFCQKLDFHKFCFCGTLKFSVKSQKSREKTWEFAEYVSEIKKKLVEI